MELMFCVAYDLLVFTKGYQTSIRNLNSVIQELAKTSDLASNN